MATFGSGSLKRIRLCIKKTNGFEENSGNTPIYQILKTLTLTLTLNRMLTLTLTLNPPIPNPNLFQC